MKHGRTSVCGWAACFAPSLGRARCPLIDGSKCAWRVPVKQVKANFTSEPTMKDIPAITPPGDELGRWWSVPHGNLLQSLSIDLSRGLSQAQIGGRRASLGSDTPPGLQTTRIL